MRDPFVFLFSESAGRVLVAVPRTEESRFRAMCEARGLPVDPDRRRRTMESDSVEVQGLVHRDAGGTAQHVRGGAARAVRMSRSPDAASRHRARSCVWAWSLVRLDFVGVAFAALFFCLSLTPSLLPRDWLFRRPHRRHQRRDRLRDRRPGRAVLRRFVLRGRSWWPPPRRGRATRCKAASSRPPIGVSLLMVIPAAAWQRQVVGADGHRGPGDRELPAHRWSSRVVAGGAADRGWRGCSRTSSSCWPG